MNLKGQREGGRLGEEGDMLGCIRVQGSGKWGKDILEEHEIILVVWMRG